MPCIPISRTITSGRGSDRQTDTLQRIARLARQLDSALSQKHTQGVTKHPVVVDDQNSNQPAAVHRSATGIRALSRV
jgi:hypothetical protein